MTNRIEERKTRHIKICLEETVQANRKTSGFEDVSLVHHALPEIDREEIDLSTTVFGHEFSAPFIIGSMTGGARGTEKINAALAKAVESFRAAGPPHGSVRRPPQYITLLSKCTPLPGSLPTGRLPR